MRGIPLCSPVHLYSERLWAEVYGYGMDRLWTRPLPTVTGIAVEGRVYFIFPPERVPAVCVHQVCAQGSPPASPPSKRSCPGGAFALERTAVKWMGPEPQLRSLNWAVMNG